MENRFKFRAWCGSHKRFVTVHRDTMWHSTHGLEVVCDEHSVHTVTTLMQSTGLLDKNGKEIFEGDIVRMETKNEGWSNWEVYWYRQEWMPSGLCVCPREVIGNIHETPELLK